VATLTANNTLYLGGTAAAGYQTTAGLSANVATLTANNASNLTAGKIVETYTAPTISAGTLTIDLSTGTVFNVLNSANVTTFTISNATASKASAFTLFITGNTTVTTQSWGSSVKWSGGTAPTLTTTNGKVDILTFVTNNGGTTWFGFVGGQNF
jgi:hypothetical protein